MSRFTNIYEKDYKDVFFDGFPVILQKSRILFDSEADRMVMQFKLINVDPSVVEKVFLKIDLLDPEGSIIKTVDEHIILSPAKQGESFGENAPLYDSDKSIARCEVVITKVALAGGRVWNNENDLTGEAVSSAKHINFLNDLRTQFYNAAAKSGIKTDCEFEERGNYWRCSCGMLNMSAKHTCPNCGSNIGTLRECFDTDRLKEAVEQKREAERIAEEQEREAAEKAAAKRKKIMKIAIPVCAVLVIAGAYVGRMTSLGGGSFPVFNDEGIAFGVDSGGTVLINRLGSKVMSDISDHEGDWNSGYWLKVNDKWGLIDNKANWLIEPTYGNAPQFGDDGCAWALSDEKWRLIDNTGAYVSDILLDECPDFNSNGLALVSANKTWGFINQSGKFEAGPFSGKKPSFNDGVVKIEFEGKYGLIDKSGKILSEPQFDAIGKFDGNVAKVCLKNKYGLIDKSGKILSEPKFDEIGTFTDNVATVSLNKKYGLIDKSGEIILEIQFDEINKFVNDYAVVKVGNKYGYINKSGKYIVEPQFDEAYDFEGGKGFIHDYVAKVRINNKYGFIDTSGKYVAEPILKSIGKKIEILAYFPTLAGKPFTIHIYYGDDEYDYASLEFDNGKLAEDGFINADNIKEAKKYGII